MKKLIFNKFIVADPEVCHGKPTFKGTRVMIWQVLAMLASGESIEGILDGYPSLSREHIAAALQYATRVTEGEKFIPFEHEVVSG